MDHWTENRPETCASLGLDCSACVRQSAATVAGLCQEMEPAGLHQIFIQLYPSPGCRPMAQAFQLSYLEASIPHKPAGRAARADAAAA
ncbi:MAG TPA: hypothetical protein VMB25_09965 [Bryobacteraceae bacterium]|nr:hypothetical protein [Bryobacteraceae bacterium]